MKPRSDGTLSRISVVLVVLLLPLLGECDLFKDEEPQEQVIRLRSREIKIPDERTAKSFSEAVKASPGKRLHAFVALKSQLDLKGKQGLEAAGLTLLFPVTKTAWAATVTKEFLDRPESESPMVRWIGPIEAGDKIELRLGEGNVPDWAKDQEGRFKVMVELFADADPSAAESVLAGFADEVRRMPDNRFTYVALIAPGKIEALASEDFVKAIEPGPVPFLPILNYTRNVTRTEAVQDIDTSVVPPVYRGRSGRGVQIGIFDTGIDRGHDDFNEFDAAGAVVRSRILSGPDDSEGHGTNVAGVAAASGRRSSSPECGAAAPYLWRGMAPRSDLISVRPDDFFGPAGQVGPAISGHGMDISNHSYVQVLNGSYSTQAADLDELIRGDRVGPSGPVPARPMVWAIGNNGVTPQWGVNEGYFSVSAPAKNAIVVGATIADTAGAIDRLYSDSALGPTFDGRVKPDLVAPGSSVRTTRDGTNCYGSRWGTSIAAPAVTGIAGLVLEEYAAVTGADLDTAPPLPSSLKAILIQTAKDLEHTVPDIHDSWDNPDTGGPVLYHAGPDYATGYGRVDASAAVSLVRNRRFVEGSISDRAQVDEYCLGSTVTTRLQATLAWDDEPDEDRFAPRTDPNLINDLELRLIEPGGATHLPWVLPPLTPAAVSGDPDPIAPADIRPAAPGEDHLNNVEQVTVTGAADGVWRLRVSVADGSVGLLETPQRYSVAADGPIVFGCSDLVVTAFEATGPAELRPVEGSDRESAHLPVRVTIENRGTGEAHPFKLAAVYSGGPSNPDRDFVVAFSVPGESSLWYPRRSERLGPGETWTVEGELVFHPSVSGSAVSIAIEADSCSGDEFVPSYCRAPESDETNNLSARISSALP